MRMDDCTPAFRLSPDFSGTVLVRQGGEICYKASRGYAVRGDYIPNALDTRFSLASVSKAFTAVAILQLVEEGYVSLDDTLADLLPNDMFSGFSEGVTIHRLLTHTSGIPDYFDESVMTDYADLWKEKPSCRMRCPADFLPLFQNLPMQFEPGSRFSYNNAGFVALALVVEAKTGKPFAEAITERVFAKAGMTESGYFSLDRLPSRCASGYRKDDSGWVSNLFSIPPVGGGDGGAWCNAADLMRFWDALAGHVLLGPTLSAQMLKRQTETGDGDGYGYGIWMKNMGKHDAWYLQGCDPGVSATSLFDPVQDVAYVVLSNTEFGVWEPDAELTRLVRTEGL